MKLISKIRETVERYHLLEKGDRVVIAVSGGPDSVCLMQALKELSGDYGLELLAAHLNHGLRGKEADRDERFAGILAGNLDIPFESARIDIPALLRKGSFSPEDLCREERYRFLREIVQKRGFNRIALGHHRDDRVETILMNFLRGSGLEGLRGLPPCRDGLYIRPLFDLSRREILEWLKAKKAAFVSDSTNQEDLYLRNRVRNRLIPQLRKEYNPKFPENMVAMSDILRDEDHFLSATAEEFLIKWERCADDGESIFPLKPLLAAHPAIQRRIIKRLLLRFSPAEKGIGHRHVSAVLDLAAGKSPSGRIDLPFRIRVRRRYDLLILGRVDSVSKEGETPVDGRAEFSYEVEIPGTTTIPESGTHIRIRVKEGWSDSERSGAGIRNAGMIRLDLDQLAFPLRIRNCRPGDRMRPLGMRGTKKISDLFIDEKVPRTEREKIPLLVDRDDILWAAGVKAGDKARPTDRSRRILVAEII